MYILSSQQNVHWLNKIYRRRPGNKRVSGEAIILYILWYAVPLFRCSFAHLSVIGNILFPFFDTLPVQRKVIVEMFFAFLDVLKGGGSRIRFYLPIGGRIVGDTGFFVLIDNLLGDFFWVGAGLGNSKLDPNIVISIAGMIGKRSELCVTMDVKSAINR